MRLAMLAGLLFGLAACTRIPDFYMPPVQRIAATDWAGRTLKHFVNMDQPDAMNYAMADVLPNLESGGWRWTLKQPRFQFGVPATAGLKLRVDHTVADITFAQTGPVQIGFWVNGHLLDTEKVEKPGQRLFEKAVPAGWLYTDQPNEVRMEIDKLWKSPTDGAERGFIVTRLGFVQ